MSANLTLVSVFVRDVARARAFYMEMLGLEPIPQLSSESFAFLKPASGSPIAIQDTSMLPQGIAAEPGGFRLDFEVDDLDATWNDWKAKGVAGLTEISDMGAGRVFFARDPEGNAIGVAQLYEPVRAMRKQMGM